jgi:hypothetical protein
MISDFKDDNNHNASNQLSPNDNKNKHEVDLFYARRHSFCLPS